MTIPVGTAANKQIYKNTHLWFYFVYFHSGAVKNEYNTSEVRVRCDSILIVELTIRF